MHRQVGRAVLHRFEAFRRHRRHELHFHRLARQQELLVQVGGAGGDLSGEELAPHLVVGVHRARTGVVLVDAHHVLPLCTARLEHARKIREHMLSLDLVPRQPVQRRCRVEVGHRRAPCGEHPASRAHSGRIREYSPAGC
jgi:hypothetical protein